MIANFWLGKTFDDYLFRPQKGVTESRRKVHLISSLTKTINLRLPVVSSNMDSVTSADMARAMALEGGLGVVPHGFYRSSRRSGYVGAIGVPPTMNPPAARWLERAATLALSALVAAQQPEPPDPLSAWLTPQAWTRDVDGPVVGLGRPGGFDDAHLFAPCVAREDGRFLLWYPGSRGAVGERVFRLGLATSEDGTTFTKHASSPVLEFQDGERSVLTPTVLRTTSGAVQREDGRIRMWFSSAALAVPNAVHTLHESTSEDGVTWTAPSPALLSEIGRAH